MPYRFVDRDEIANAQDLTQEIKVDLRQASANLSQALSLLFPSHICIIMTVSDAKQTNCTTTNE